MTRRTAGATLAVLVATVLLAGLLPGRSAVGVDGDGTVPSYRNPVSKGFTDTFADPSVIRGKDGWWYSYGTSDPLYEGEKVFHRIPMARSRNLVDWTYVADAFSAANLPAWTAPNASIWAPDIRYVDGQYRMYYVVTETKEPGGTPEPNDNAVGMATAPTPVGPWTDSGAPVVGPRRGGAGEPGNFTWTFDPSAVTDTDGTQWLFYGSYYGGVFVIKLNADGTKTVGEATMVAIDNKFEGSYVVRRGGYWFFFGSVANCCAGPTTGYSVQVGRSKDLRGPYVDREGVTLLESRAGGSPTLVQNGNRWIGAGHNAVVTDLAGQDWIAYHALGRDDPWLDEPGGITERPMLLDRLDWVGGWPYVRADAGPSDDVQTGPKRTSAGPRGSCCARGPLGCGWGSTSPTMCSGPTSTSREARAVARPSRHCRRTSGRESGTRWPSRCAAAGCTPSCPTPASATRSQCSTWRFRARSPLTRPARSHGGRVPTSTTSASSLHSHR